LFVRPETQFWEDASKSDLAICLKHQTENVNSENQERTLIIRLYWDDQGASTLSSILGGTDMSFGGWDKTHAYLSSLGQTGLVDLYLIIGQVELCG
jgi:hypothetical protein